MSRIKSLIIRCEIDVAQRAHNCKGNARHRIEKGDRRLKVRYKRTWHHYCLQCANVIVRHNRGIIDELAHNLQLPSDGVQL